MALRLHVRVTSNARVNEIVGWDGDELRVRVVAPAVEGRANGALVRLVAGALSVPERNVELLRGARSRHKVLAIEGYEESKARALLGISSNTT